MAANPLGLSVVESKGRVRATAMLGLGDAPDLTGGASRRASASSFQPLGDTQSLMGGGRAAAADPLEDSDMNTDELGMGLDAILGGETVVGGGDAGDDEKKGRHVEAQPG